MILKRAEDYRFVEPDADAMEGGAHPFSGDIYPKRSDDRKNIMSYEDICFLQEACGELVSALMYFDGRVPDYFPYGKTYYYKDGDPVPRALLGAAVGRFSKNYGSTLSPPYYMRSFQYHNPSGGTTYLDKFISSVGKDVKRLFTEHMGCSPYSGKTLEELKGFKQHDICYGYLTTSSVYSWINSSLFDVFYTLVTLASSMEPLKATADPNFDPDGVAASFGSYYIAHYMVHWWSILEGALARRAYEELAYHDGYIYFFYATGSGARCGPLSPVFVDPSFKPSMDTGAVMETSAEQSGNYPPSAGIVTFSAGGKVFTSTELLQESELMGTVIDHDPRSLQLAYGALEASLGMKLSEMSMGVVELSPEVDITKAATSMELSQEMLAPLWRLPGLCRRIFIPRMWLYYILREGNYTGFNGGRITDRNNWDIRIDTGAVEEGPGWTEDFPGFSFSKDIEGSVTVSVSPDEEQYESHRSSYSRVSAYNFPSGPKDPTVSPYMSRGYGGVMWASALNGILKEVEATVFATVRHYDAAWVNLNGNWQTVRFESVTKTYPIRYTLVPSFNGTEILWTPSKTEAEIVDEALGYMGFDRGCVFPDSYLTDASPLPDPSSDSRIPDITVAPGEYGSAYFSERVEVRFGLPEAKSNDGFWFSGDSVHYGFAEIVPRTADQT